MKKMTPPKGRSKPFYKGWEARLAGKKNKPPYKYPDILYISVYEEVWDETYLQYVHPKILAYRKRIKEWTRGYISCSRTLGRERKRIREAEALVQENREHDIMTELGREYYG